MADPDISTRREFVRRSMLAYATATLGAKLGPGAAKGAEPAAVPFPVSPYGSGPPVYLNDFERCQPGSALARRRRPHCWTLMDLVTEKTDGRMLVAGTNAGVPDLEYPFRHQGWHAIHFGIISLDTESRLLVRLKSDPVFSILAQNSMPQDHLIYDDIQWNKHSFSSHGVEEMFWKYADLKGESDPIVLGQLKAQIIPGDENAMGNTFMPCWLAYIKLVPLSDEEVAQLQADRVRRDTRRLFATDDTFTAPSYLHFRTENDIRRQIEPYRDSDFARLYWEAGVGDLTFYPSKVGRLITFAWSKDFHFVWERLAGETFAGFQARGIDPFRVAMDYAHEIGLEFHASYRVEGFHFPPPEEEWNLGGLYDLHPEWRCLDRQGQPTPRMSYGFPEVRKFVVDMLAEMAGYPIDGVCLLYNRRLPVVEYEAPLVESFKGQYGVDPRSLDERDPRWQAHRAEVITGFMRGLRSRLRAEEQRQGRKPIAITAVIPGNREDNYDHGLDLQTWVKDDLVDTLIPYIDKLGPYMAGSAASRAKRGDLAWDDPHAIDYFLQLTKNSKCVLAPNLMPRGIEPEDYRRIASALYAAGVESLYFWDTYMRTNCDRSWSALRRLGHKDEVQAWTSAGRPPMAPSQIKIQKLGDWNMAYQTPG